MKNHMLDKNAQKIVTALEQDARMSFAALGDEIGMSKTPCWNKVQQLQASGVIEGYSAQLNPKALGLTIRALVHVVVDFEHYQAFEQAINAHKAVRSCHAVTGDSDYVLEILASDIEAFDELLRAQLSRLPGVQRFNTAISTRMVKNNGPYAAMLT
ncbi:Lrp/AsnC family transcriptional regulator [Paraglaciecola polaris]|uniref:AsnC family transcriptional regulator n=2 Tax=Paraglaciecola polaris TaxID=222814 RepID=K7AEL0_9ALTE|nr:Lrp/AsnC family transcriptional regulator [Paraglaciecola polaris]GAC33750.1 AsnC family transcriptional regulator [Paraglaciecola polaris LMG 21857]|tara:strand:+ start:944 stop:1411 length:468 start_codon:yes stop_codon:yes gene_type:complete